MTKPILYVITTEEKYTILILWLQLKRPLVALAHQRKAETAPGSEGDGAKKTAKMAGVSKASLS